MDTAILNATWELFLEHGAGGTSIERVARRAGVSRLTVYRRYHGRQDLLLHMLEWARGDDFLDSDSAERTLDSVVDSALDALSRPAVLKLLTRLVGTVVEHPRLVDAYWQHYVLPRRRAFTAVLQRAQQEGRLDPDADLEAIMDMVAGAVFYHLLLRPEQRGRAQLRDRFHAALRQAGLRLDS